MSASEEELLLRERARALARPVEPERRRQGMEAILFRASGSRYALPLHEALRILPVRDLTPLPGARRPLAGLASWRGGLLPLVDLRLLASAGRGRGIGDLTRIVVFGNDDEKVGILAESIDRVIDLDPASIAPLADETVEQRHLRGMTHDAVLVLDAPGFLEMLRGG